MWIKPSENVLEKVHKNDKRFIYGQYVKQVYICFL